MENLGTYLTDDHERCDALLRSTQQFVGAANWADARRAIGAFQYALERHFLIEERILYPAFEVALGHATSPTVQMRAEHLRIRAGAQRLTDAVDALSAQDFMKHAETFLLTDARAFGAWDILASAA